MFTTFYPPYSFGGDAVGVQRMARALAARGHQVTVVHDEDAYLSLGGTMPGSQPAADGVRAIGLRSRHGMLATLVTQQTGHPLVHRRRIRAVLAEVPWDIIWYNNTSLVGGPGLLAMGEGLKIYEAHEHWLVCPTHVLWRYNSELCDKRDCTRCVLNYRRPPQLWRYTGMLDKALDQVDLLIAKSEFSRKKHREFGLPKENDIRAILQTADVPHAVFDQAPLMQWLPSILFAEPLAESGVDPMLIERLRFALEAMPVCGGLGAIAYRKFYVAARTFEATAALEPIERPLPEVPITVRSPEAFAVEAFNWLGAVNSRLLMDCQSWICLLYTSPSPRD